MDQLIIIGSVIGGAILGLIFIFGRVNFSGTTRLVGALRQSPAQKPVADEVEVASQEDPVPAGMKPYCGICGSRMRRSAQVTGTRFDRESGQKVEDYYEAWTCPHWRHSTNDETVRVNGTYHWASSHDHKQIGQPKARWA